MSLILEALNKAEKSEGASDGYSAPQIHLHEKRTHTKWTFILLIIIGCLISIIIGLLILNKPSLTNKARKSNEYLTPAPLLQPDQKENSEQPYNQNITQDSIHKAPAPASYTSNSPQNKALLSENSPTQHREPSLYQLVEPSSRHKDEPALTTYKTANTADSLKQEQRANIQAEPSSSPASSREITSNTKDIKDIRTAPNIQLADIKISVHRYSETPTKRFVYINSTRYAEGSTINNDLLIDEITENGVILNSHNTLYRLPLNQ